MALNFPGFVQSVATVPSGVSVSASIGASSTATTVSLTAGEYTPSELCAHLETQLNASVSPYPQTAAAMSAAVGYGTWSAGWLCQETSGDLAAAFGSPTLVDSGTPVYSVVGPAVGGDLAVTVDSSDYFTGADVYDVTDVQDLCVAWVGQFGTAVGVDLIISKQTAAADGWAIFRNGSTLTIRRVTGGGVTTNDSTTASISFITSEYHVGIATIDRSTGKARIGVRGLTSLTTVVSTEGTEPATTMTNASEFRLGAQAGYGANGGSFTCAGFYVGVGASSATGLSANLSTALTNFANAINDTWSVDLDTSTGTGTVEISGSFWGRSVEWPSTALRDALGFDRSFSYPETAAQLASIVGGTWTSGSAWLCNESSGDLAPVFGSVTLADTSTPTYSNLGARGGTDKAIGFDSAADGFSGGDVFDVTATDDIVLFWVGKVTTTVAGNRDFFGKNSTSYYCHRSSNGKINFTATDGVDTPTSNCDQLLNEHHVGMCVIERATNTLRIAIRGVRSGTTNLGAATDATALGSTASANSFVLGTGAASSADTDLVVSFFAVTVGSGVATGLSSGISTALAAFAASLTSQTGDDCAAGLWMPDCPLNCDSDPLVAPEVSDLRTTQSPTGAVLGLAGNKFYRHTNVRWDAVPRARAWESGAETPGSSYQHWFRETQMGMGHEWFSAASRVEVHWSNAGVDTLLGEDDEITRWKLTGLDSVALPKKSGDWTGLWTVVWPALIGEDE